MNAPAAYLLIQGASGLLWWLLILVWPETRSLFFATGLSEASITSLWLPDLVIFVGGSVFAALLVLRHHAAGPWVALFTTGGAAYAALFSFSASAATGGGWLGAVLMAFAVVGSAWATRRAMAEL